MEKKLRIQLFDDEGKLINDRMVSQDPEFNVGPKETHNGLFRIEFTLENQDDIERCKTYLDKLVGNLPLESKTKKAKKELIPDDPNYRENLLAEVLALDPLDQDILISYLRKKGFVFRTWDYLSMVDLKGVAPKDRHQEEYQWMIYEIRSAKNPKSDKLDPMLMFGIKLVGERSEKVIVYLNGEYEGVHKIPLPEKPKEVFKKTTMQKFPEFMVEDERTKYQIELRSYQLNPEKKISKFFNRWMKYVENTPELPNPNPYK